MEINEIGNLNFSGLQIKILKVENIRSGLIGKLPQFLYCLKYNTRLKERNISLFGFEDLAFHL